MIQHSRDYGCSSTHREDLVVEVVFILSNLTLADEPVKHRGTFDIFLVTSVRRLRLRRLNPTTNISTVSLREESYSLHVQ